MPVFFKSNGSLPVRPASETLDWLQGDIIAHTSRGIVGLANVTWVSTINGMIDISEHVWDAREGLGRSNNWSLMLGAALLASGTIGDGDSINRTNPASFGGAGLQNLAVSIGDVLKLEFIRIGSGEDYVGMNLTVIADDLLSVPEPTTIALMGLALAGLGFQRRKAA